jgi:hypothetical protein
MEVRQGPNWGCSAKEKKIMSNVNSRKIAGSIPDEFI